MWGAIKCPVLFNGPWKAVLLNKSDRIINFSGKKDFLENFFS